MPLYITENLTPTPCSLTRQLLTSLEKRDRTSTDALADSCDRPPPELTKEKVRADGLQNTCSVFKKNSQVCYCQCPCGVSLLVSFVYYLYMRDLESSDLLCSSD